MEGFRGAVRQEAVRPLERTDAAPAAYVERQGSEVRFTGRGVAAHPRDGHAHAARVPSSRWQSAKRVVDPVLAGLLLVVLLPIMVLIAILIRLDTPGPVFFRQRRHGKDREPFTLLKFRTMYDGVSPELHRKYVESLATAEVDGAGLKKLADDPRVTRVGRALRKSSLDELPQLLNVVLGDMALVGPRPAIAYELPLYAAADFERFDVLPGLTGLWQVSGRSELGFREMLELDVAYARDPSLRRDAAIMARTPLALVRGRAA